LSRFLNESMLFIALMSLMMIMAGLGCAAQ